MAPETTMVRRKDRCVQRSKPLRDSQHERQPRFTSTIQSSDFHVKSTSTDTTGTASLSASGSMFFSRIYVSVVSGSKQILNNWLLKA